MNPKLCDFLPLGPKARSFKRVWPSSYLIHGRSRPLHSSAIGRENKRDFFPPLLWGKKCWPSERAREELAPINGISISRTDRERFFFFPRRNVEKAKREREEREREREKERSILLGERMGRIWQGFMQQQSPSFRYIFFFSLSFSLVSILACCSLFSPRSALLE